MYVLCSIEIKLCKKNIYPIFQDGHFKTCHKVEIPSPIETTERVLNSQVLNVGRSLGVNLHSTQMFGHTTSVKMFGNPH